MADLNAGTNGRSRLVLLIDADPATRQVVGPLLGSSGLELIQARDSLAGLEILQRLPERFRLAIVSLEMPGLSGAVLIATLQVFRPELPVVCLTGAEPIPVEASSGCVAKPLQPDQLRGRVAAALGGSARPVMDLRIASEIVERARRAFARSQSLVDAAEEIARGIPGETVEGW
jgi:CheY-like chemotaxis protein